MCGIAGIFGQDQLQNHQQRIARMLTEIGHRGPDGEGTWFEPSGVGGMGHRRLAIIDVDGGKQPMSNEDDTIWISFNGCIYNYQDIQRELREKGHRFRTHSDTEVIVHAYEEWGPACVERFNGMWAFAIWDGRSRTVFCSRDRIGVKPLYYTWDGRQLVLASEIKALLASDAVAARVNTDGMRQYLTFQYCLGENTLFEGVHRLPPGHNLTLAIGQAPKISRYWDLTFHIDEQHDEAYFVDRLNRLLEDAVRLRLRSDVPLGAHLSGGMDSSVVVSLARLLLGEAPIKTFCGAFAEGAAFDETRYAKIASQAAQTEYIETYLTAADFEQSIEKIIWHMDEPAAGPGVLPR